MSNFVKHKKKSFNGIEQKQYFLSFKYNSFIVFFKEILRNELNKSVKNYAFIQKALKLRISLMFNI